MVDYDIVLMSPPSRMDNHYRPPLALLYLGGFLTSRGLKVKILDEPITAVRNKKFWQNREHIINRTKEIMLANLSSLRTGFVGISCYSTEYNEVCSLINEIKRHYKPYAKVIVGGIHPTLKPSDFKGIADHIVVGYGETVLYQILTNKDPGNKIEMFIPDYSLIDMNYYTQANPYAIRGCFLRSAYILSSRGCPCKCSFCAAPSMHKYYGGALTRIPESILLEIDFLKQEYKIDSFYFIDDLFGINTSYLRYFCNHNTGLLWGCSSKIGYLDEESIKLMSKAGCVQIDFGIERGSNEELSKLKKGITIRGIVDAFDMCHEYKIRTFANFLIGLPWDNTLHYMDIERLIMRIKPTVISLNPFTAYYGTELYNNKTIEIRPPEMFYWIAYMRKYNSIWNAIRFHISLKYLRALWKSKRKRNYIKQLKILITEFINQKWM